jgi:hypothetical protein
MLTLIGKESVMKHLILPACFLALLSSDLPAQQTEKAAPIFRPHFSLKLTGGMARWGMGDWNEYYGRFESSRSRRADGTNTYYGDKLHYGKDGGVEIRYAINPNYQIGLGLNRAWGKTKFGWDQETSFTGPSRTSKTGTLDYYYKEDRTEKFNTRSTYLNLSIYAYSNSYPFRSYFGIGLDYHLSSYTHFHDDSYYSRIDTLEADVLIGTRENENSVYFDNDMSANGIGLHALIGFEYFFIPRISLIGEVKGLYAKISGYTGKQTSLMYDGEMISEDVKSIVRLGVEGTGDWEVQDFYTMPEDEPIPAATTGQFATEYREATLNFSGLYLNLGLVYHF